MGYETHYTAKAEYYTPSEDPQEILKEWLEQKDELREIAEEYGCTCKFWNYKEDLLQFSKKNPEILVTIHGQGEDEGDLWTAYFCQGKVQVESAKITIDPFDPKKLK